MLYDFSELLLIIIILFAYSMVHTYMYNQRLEYNHIPKKTNQQTNKLIINVTIFGEFTSLLPADQELILYVSWMISMAHADVSVWISDCIWLEICPSDPVGNRAGQSLQLHLQTMLLLSC